MPTRAQWTILALNGLALASGCNAVCDETPPAISAEPAPLELVGAHFRDSTHVELVFSSPLRPTDGVDPTKFRLSVSSVDREVYSRSCDTYTTYCDLSRGLSDYGCGRCEYGYYGGYGIDDEAPCPEPTVVTALVAMPDDPARLILTINPPLRPLICDQADYVGDDGGIVVHFSSLDIPTITAEDGFELAALGAEFVLDGSDQGLRSDGAFPDRDAVVRVRCPEDA